jgi:glycosyltransferase involved in cell wall biosynthesis
MTTFLIVWLCTQVIAVALVFAYSINLGQPAELAATPRAAIIVAVKGHDPEFDECLKRLFAQDYPAYRVIFAVESESDPAVAAIEPYRRATPDRVSLVVAGLAEHEGQKTTNLLAAVTRLSPDDEMLVFADADIWPEPDWLRRLIAPLVDGNAEIVTGFSWMIVKDGKLSSLVLTAMAASVATIPRLPMLNGVWGGSAAMRQRHFHELEMTRNWRGTLSDDLHLTNIAQAAGDRIAVPREVLLRTAIYTKGFGDVIAGARRWYMLVRIHLPAAYAATVLAMSFVALGWIVTLAGAVSGHSVALVVLIAALVLSILRTFGRFLIVKRLWGDAGVAENLPFLKYDWLVSPLAVLVNALCGWSALFMRRTTWAGITYEVRGPQDVRILSRAQP